jgi:hypothetical protein
MRRVEVQLAGAGADDIPTSGFHGLGFGVNGEGSNGERGSPF